MSRASRRKNRLEPSRPAHNLEPSNVPYNAELALDRVDNPYKSGEQISVTRSLRNDPLAGLYARKQINQAQFTAGRQWQAYYEAAGIGLVIAIDPLKEPVDGRGAGTEAFTDAQLRAFRKLKQARELLGLAGTTIVVEVLGEGLQITDVANRHGFSSQLMVRYFGARFRECLETLARSWNLAGSLLTTKRID